MKRNWLILGSILLLALSLRIYQISHDSLWYDEAGVVLAAQAPTAAETLRIAQTHVAAMPLNYLQTRLLLLFGDQEGWLRLPSALWGTLAVFAFYWLAKNLTNEKTALIAAAFLAVHPFHIQYSQELRFYASGSFSYLIGTVLLLRAIKQGGFKDWALAVVVTSLGAYDFPYTVFAWFNALMIGIGLPSVRAQMRTRLFHFGLSGLTIGLLFLPGYLLFGQISTFDYYPSTANAVRSLMIGMGWLPMNYSVGNAPVWFGALLFFGMVIGLVVNVRARRWGLMGWLGAIVIEIGMVLGADFSSNYFVAPRQFLAFLPVGLLLAASVPAAWMDWPHSAAMQVSDLREPTMFLKINRVLGSLCLGAVLISAIPVLDHYYQAPKSYAREVTTVLAKRLTSTDKVYIVPWYEPLLFRYYTAKQGYPYREEQWIGLQWDDLAQQDFDTATSYLITHNVWTNEYQELISNLGFQVLWERPGYDMGAHQLYVRPAGNIQSSVR